MKPLRHRPHVYIRKEAISKKLPKRRTKTGPGRPQARPRDRKTRHLPLFEAPQSPRGTPAPRRPPSSAQTFTQIFLVFALERSLAVARTPLTVREQTGWSDRSPPGPLLHRRHGPTSARSAERGALGWRGWTASAHRRGPQRRPFQMERGDWWVAGLKRGSDWPVRVARQGRCAAIFKRRGAMKATELAFSAMSATFAPSLGGKYGHTAHHAAF